ncbi:cutinase, partial [Mycena epipterygia]
PPLKSTLRTVLGDKTMTFTGVDYPADVFGFLESGSAQGDAEMAREISNRPRLSSASLISTGYSQGGQLVHKSAKMLDPDVSARIKAVVIFGDPDNGQTVQGIPSSAIDIICHTGDAVCADGRGAGLLQILNLAFILLTAPEHT